MLITLKGKQSDIRRLGVNRILDVIELIHTDTYGPFHSAFWSGQQLQVTFMDDYSCYSYLHFIYKKSQSLTHVQDL